MITKPLRVLLTGGRAPVTLELARILHDAGCEVYVAESAAYHLCRVSSAVAASFRVPPPRTEPEGYIAALTALIERCRIHLLVPMCEEIFYIAEGIARLPQHCRVLAVRTELLAKLHHKYSFASLAELHGCRVPSTRLITGETQWRHAVREAQDGTLVLKPAYSRFAARVIMPQQLRCSAGGPACTPAPPELSPARPWVAQRYVPGRAICTFSLASEGQLLAHAAYESKYRTGAVGASVHFMQLNHPAALAWVRRFVEATGLSGHVGFDFIDGEDGVLYAIECNPRATSGLHLFRPLAGQYTAAILSGQQSDGGLLQPPPGSKAMLTLPMAACGLRLAAQPRQWRAWLDAWRGTPDAVYRRGDSRPAWEQLRIVADAWRRSRSSGLSMTEVLTDDIEWNGER